MRSFDFSYEVHRQQLCEESRRLRAEAVKLQLKMQHHRARLVELGLLHDHPQR
jgi:hypothetical protein